MKIVFASLDSGGFLYPSLAIARAAQRAGHDVRVLTSRAHGPLLDDLGLAPLVPELSSTGSFDVRVWAQLETAGIQLRWLERGIGRFGADVLVSQPLVMGAALASELGGIPLVQLGSVIALWRPGAKQHRNFIEAYAAVHAGLGLAPKPCSGDRWLGDVHLVQGVPELDAAAGALPPTFVHIGRCDFEPRRARPELDRWIEARRGRPIVYVHLGRTFSTPSSLNAIAAACDAAGISMLVATDRTDDGANRVLPASVFVAPDVPYDAVLPHCTGVISGGHPAGVAASLAHGLPLVLVPSGSGTPEIAQACAATKVAVVVDGNPTSEQLDAALDALLHDTRLRSAASAMQRAFARYEASTLACVEIEAVVRAPSPSLPRASVNRGA